MARGIVDIQNMGDALRNTGYKNIESAVSEIIDNSVEAEAKNIFVILSEGTAESGRKVVNNIAFLDNGIGMDTDTLEGCLGIGVTTHTKRTGMGRFGVGLPQASLYACPEIEVYSWRDGIQNCQKVFLDINKVKSGEQTELPDPTPCTVPAAYEGFINFKTKDKVYDFSQSGALVIWKNCDRLTPKTRGPLVSRLEFAIGQKFRHFINEDNCSIKIICMENQENAVDVYPNDPLFLMTNNYVLCDPKKPLEAFIKKQGPDLEPCFEPYGDKKGIEIPVKYIDASGEVAVSPVTVRFSIVKSKFYDQTAYPGKDPGSSQVGQIAKRMEGISVVRANREIDFRKFDFYDNINEPTHRWWGCEIRFMPELDEAFGVSNNKQYVELNRIEKEAIDHDEEVPPVWQQIERDISTTIRAMYDKNKEKRKGTRSADKTQTATQDIVNAVESEDKDVQSETKDIKVNTPLKELVEKAQEELKEQGVEQPTEEEAKQFIDTKVHIGYKNQGRGPVFDFDFELGTANIVINMGHEFYTAFLEKIIENPDAKTTFELFVASFVMAVDETNTYQTDENNKLFSRWNEKLKKYMQELLNPRD